MSSLPVHSSFASGDLASGPSVDPAAVSGDLAERERAILDFERQWWKHAGAKEHAIRERFDLSPARYYQVLNGLLDRPAALAYDAMLVKRLRRVRSSRLRGGSAQRLPGES